MPVIQGSVQYNCQVFCFNGKILMICPKMCLAYEGNYKELRWFSAWKHKDQLIDFQLPHDISEVQSQKSVPFGYGYIQFLDTAVAAEICEELFTPNAPYIELALNGVEFFMNASGSHHQLRKLDLRLGVIKSASLICGGVYMYSNHWGCDGGRLYYGYYILKRWTRYAMVDSIHDDSDVGIKPDSDQSTSNMWFTSQ